MFVSICLRDGWLGSPRLAATWTLQFSARASHPSAARSAALLCEHSLALHCPASGAHLPTEGVRQPSIDGEGPGEDHGQLLRPAARSTDSRTSRSIIPKRAALTRLPKRRETMRSVACIAMLLINAASLRPSQRRPRLQAPCAAAANRQATQRDAAP